MQITVPLRRDHPPPTDVHTIPAQAHLLIFGKLMLNFRMMA